MTEGQIIQLIMLGAFILCALITIIVAIVRGDMKKFIVEQMEIAEKSGKTGKEKLEYVLAMVKEKYKILELILNVKQFIETIIDISKQINVK